MKSSVAWRSNFAVFKWKRVVVRTVLILICITTSSHTESTSEARGPVKYSLRHDFVLPWGGFHYFISGGLTGEWIMLTAPVWNIECKLWFCIFLDGGGDIMPAAFFSPVVGPRDELRLAGSQQRCLRGGARERILSVPLQSLQITRRWAFLHALLLMY